MCANFKKEIPEVKDLKARNYGSNAVVDVVLSIDKTLDFYEAHEVATEVELKKLQKY
ncbi:cation transporter dimerization domain-containing protein [Paenibacillus sp. YAF4_2]|uniref:cation transporter dimerization domain-containing protein n=1 Tax=Paenibacillus sp. YAF4_2 TaxID=3233085 RepID=UPI003F98486A